MKIIFIFISYLFSLTVISLESCPVNPEEKWHNCEGSYQYPTGETYSGEWQNNLFHGNGIFLYENGDRYVGNFKNDLHHGQGTYQYKNGDYMLANGQKEKGTERVHMHIL